MATPPTHPRDPLHGVTLESILQQLLEQYGWAEMGWRIPIRCFQYDPSIKSSLKFLRKTPWARAKVEDWFIEAQGDRRRAQERAADESARKPDDLAQTEKLLPPGSEGNISQKTDEIL